VWLEFVMVLNGLNWLALASKNDLLLLLDDQGTIVYKYLMCGVVDIL
jgi:hypothetical protein